MMKKRVFLLLITLSISHLSPDLHTNKTMFVPHSPGLDLVLQEPLLHYKRNKLQNPETLDISHSFFYQTSTNPGDIRRYFFINGQDSLLVKDADASGYRDIAADWLNIDSLNPNTGLSLFQSTLKMHPHSYRHGLIYNARYQLPFPSNMWCELIVPFVQAETRLSFREENIQSEQSLPNGSAIDVSTNARTALKNPFWEYGKFKQTANRKAGLGDIRFKVGVTPLKKENVVHNLYGTFLIPTAPHPTNEYIFEPFLGNGGHCGLGAGSQLDWNFFNEKYHSVDLLSTIDYLYLLKSTQFRSFDLTSNGPWSRYLEVVSTARPDNVNYGINFFTKRMNIKPGSSLTVLSTLHYAYTLSCTRALHFEVGHSLWYREKEEVTLTQPWTESIGIASLTAGNDGDTTHSKTQPTATIATNKQTISTSPFSPIAATNLNLDSAAHPTCISNTAFIALGLDGMYKHHKYNINGGISFEKGNSNAVLDQWSFWLSCALTL